MAEASLFHFDDSYARAVPELSVCWQAVSFPKPELVALNENLARELGVDPAVLRGTAGISVLVGQPAEGVEPVAQAYAGHQFGGYSPLLGDGRALLLGEVTDVTGRRRDLALKGSGPTPFARGADGKAVLGPMLREYLVGEAMHGLGIPTTRALSVVTTGEGVVRDGIGMPGAVLCRVAASHLRVGTFQLAASMSPQVLRSLADYAIDRHYPACRDTENPYLDLLAQVADAQARLVVQWMLVGLVHGVMNTDNMAISGESIDFGPCAFIDAFDPATVFSSIDRGGRYAYGNQPAIAQWNLARFAEALLPLIDDMTDAAIEKAMAVLNSFPKRYDALMDEGLAAKLGLAEPDRALAEDLLVLLKRQQVDYTRFFRALAVGTAVDLFTDQASFQAWQNRWEQQLPQDRTRVFAAMNRVNPVYIPRNHRVEQALASAHEGNLEPFWRLIDAVSQPFDERRGLEDLTGPGPIGSRYVTYCGT